MNYILLLVSVIINVTGSSITGKFAKKDMITLADSLKFNMLVSAAAALLFIAAGIGPASPYTLFSGVIFGITNAMALLFRTSALSCGPMAFTLLISSCGLIIPAFSRQMFWNEAITVWQIAGVMLMIASLYIIISPRQDRKVTLRWLIFSFSGFLCTGAISLMQKIHQKSEYVSQRNGFLIAAFITSSCVMLFAYIIYVRVPRRTGVNSTKLLLNFKLKTAALAVSAGLCTGAVHIINLYLSGVMPSVIFFPLVNGGAILLSGAAGRVLFKEKFSRVQLFGFFLGIFSIAMIGNAALFVFGK